MSIAPTGSISNIVLGYEINGKNYTNGLPDAKWSGGKLQN